MEDNLDTAKILKVWAEDVSNCRHFEGRELLIKIINEIKAIAENLNITSKKTEVTEKKELVTTLCNFSAILSSCNFEEINSEFGWAQYVKALSQIKKAVILNDYGIINALLEYASEQEKFNKATESLY